MQRSIPIKRIFRDGIWQVGGKFSKSWAIADINYSVASAEDQLGIFVTYCALINALPTDAATKITINNRSLDPVSFERNVLMQHRPDGLDYLRDEYNDMLKNKVEDSNNLTKDKLLTVSVEKKNIQEARTFFTRVHNDLVANLRKLSSRATPIAAYDRLSVLHNFFRPDDPHFTFDLVQAMRRGHDFRDLVCPDSLQFKGDHFEMGGRFGRVLFLRDYASFIKDTMITDLCDLPRNLMLSIDLLPVPTDEAVGEMVKRVMAVEGDITRWQQRTNQNNNFSAQIPYEMEQMRGEVREFLDDLTARDQRMILAVVTLVHVADSLEELNADTETLQSVGRKHLCTFSVLREQQEDGLATVIPYGLRRIDALRTLTTESTAVLMPFSVQDIQHPGGIYLGINSVSRNLILCDRGQLMSPHGFILGASGSGKSAETKAIIEQYALNTDDDILILDAEREYSPLAEALGGEVVYVSAASANHINAMDLSRDYGDESPVAAKCEFVLSLCEQLMGAGQLRAKEKSLIDRCTASVYRKYARDFKGNPPTLQDFHAELLRQREPEAHDIALAMELFTKGSLNTFAHQTNVNLSSRIVAYDLYELGKALKTMGMLVVLDAILNRVTANRRSGKRTHIIVDEVHLYFANEYSANFLAMCWRLFRKYNGYCLAATQRVEDCLRSETGRTMLGLSEFVVLLNQSSTDRVQLADLLNISEAQLSYITNSEQGCGLVKIGPSLIPFENKYTPGTELYRLLTTKPGEG